MTDDVSKIRGPDASRPVSPMLTDATITTPEHIATAPSEQAASAASPSGSSASASALAVSRRTRAGTPPRHRHQQLLELRAMSPMARDTMTRGAIAFSSALAQRSESMQQAEIKAEFAEKMKNLQDADEPGSVQKCFAELIALAKQNPVIAKEVFSSNVEALATHIHEHMKTSATLTRAVIDFLKDYIAQHVHTTTKELLFRSTQDLQSRLIVLIQNECLAPLKDLESGSGQYMIKDGISLNIKSITNDLEKYINVLKKNMQVPAQLAELYKITYSQVLATYNKEFANVQLASFIILKSINPQLVTTNKDLSRLLQALVNFNPDTPSTAPLMTMGKKGNTLNDYLLKDNGALLQSFIDRVKELSGIRDDTSGAASSAAAR